MFGPFGGCFYFGKLEISLKVTLIVLYVIKNAIVSNDVLCLQDKKNLYKAKTWGLLRSKKIL